MSEKPKSLKYDSFLEKVEECVERAVSETRIGTKRDPNYNADENVKFAMEDIIESYNRGPDVLLVSDGLNIQCYSDEPDRLGKVLLWGFGIVLPQTQELKPIQLCGYSETWTEELSSERDGNSNFDYKSFLVGFIERNLMDKTEIVPQFIDVKTGEF